MPISVMVGGEMRRGAARLIWGQLPRVMRPETLWVASSPVNDQLMAVWPEMAELLRNRWIAKRPMKVKGGRCCRGAAHKRTTWVAFEYLTQLMKNITVGFLRMFFIICITFFVSFSLYMKFCTIVYDVHNNICLWVSVMYIFTNLQRLFVYVFFFYNFWASFFIEVEFQWQIQKANYQFS